MKEKLKLIAGRLKYPVIAEFTGGRIYFEFPYNVTLMEEIKVMKGSKYHGYDTPNPRKIWSVEDCPRNQFQLSYLKGENPYAWFDQDLKPFEPNRKMLYKHQLKMAQIGYTYRYAIWAAQMRTGKTLAAIEVIEKLGRPDIFWVGPKSALASVKLEFEKWGTKVKPIFMTFEHLKKIVEGWTPGYPPPHILIVDEASRCKNETAQRSVAVQHMADAIRKEYGYDGCVILMSGSPAPKSPVDWKSLTDIVCPGYLREGRLDKFRARLALIKKSESITGGMFPKLVTWWDDPKKCGNCGKFEDDFIHSSTECIYIPSKDEVSFLYQRMKGITHVFMKKDCFSWDTEILTKQGPRRIGECVGWQELYVETPEGMKWLNCEIKSFGQQVTIPLQFGDGTRIRATGNHRWLYNRKGKRVKHYLRTTDLIIGKTELPLAPIVLPTPSEEGIAHGFVFGDGSIAISQRSGQKSCRVPLYGNDRDLISVLLNFGKLDSMSDHNGVAIPVINALPLEWKELPIRPSKAYAFGFILGLLQADGCITKSSINIYQANKAELIEIRKLAIYAGIRCQPIRLSRSESPIDGNQEHKLYRFSMSTYNIDVAVLHRVDYKSKFLERGRRTCTTVTRMDCSDLKSEEVYCAVVPGYNNFTLANGIISMNCLDLPAKIFQLKFVPPTHSMLNGMETIVNLGLSAAETLTRCRELSDGFQYQDIVTGVEECPECRGNKITLQEFYIGPEATTDELAEYGVISACQIPRNLGNKDYWKKEKASCPHCRGKGQVNSYERQAVSFDSPKEEALKEILAEHEEHGRCVIGAGFTGSIDKIVTLVDKIGWKFIRVDGRGWFSNIPDITGEFITNELVLLKIFQKLVKDEPLNDENIAFIGHPGSAGMGLDLSASPTIVNYSNSFNGEDRIQFIERIHGPAMNTNLGATIVDLICLATDKYVLDNLNKKIDLQSLTMGQLKASLHKERMV